MRAAHVKWLLITLCWLIWGLFNASRLRLVVPDGNWAQALEYALPDALIWALLTPVVVYLARRLPVRPENIRWSIPLHLVLALVAALSHTLLDTASNFIFGSSLGFWALFGKIARHTVHLNILVYIIIVCVAQYLMHYWKMREDARQNAELRAQLSDARLASLESQLRPHFLFNTLHTISGLMERDPGGARQVIVRLSELLRRSLRSGEQHEIPLAQELDNVRAYLEIEQVRFAGRLETHIETDAESLRCAVPGFILQPIVENAVRHGVAVDPQGGRIDVSATCRNGRLRLEVRDTGPGPGPETDGRGVGLANTRARLRELYGERGRIELAAGSAGGAVVTIAIPRRSV